MMEVGIQSTGDDLLGIVLMSRLTSSSVGGGRSSSGRPVKAFITIYNSTAAASSGRSGLLNATFTFKGTSPTNHFYTDS